MISGVQIIPLVRNEVVRVGSSAKNQECYRDPLIRSELFPELMDDIDASLIRMDVSSWRDTPPWFGMRSR